MSLTSTVAAETSNSALEFVSRWPADKKFVDLGLIDYEKALEIQMAFVDRVHQNDEAGFIIFCRHPAIITLGRATKEGDITDWKGPQLQVSRGGRVTYHGPSQLVVYPIVNLNHATSARPAKDIHAYIRLLENCVVEGLKTLHLDAHGKSTEQDTGIWVGEKKVASIGIAVRHWITYHGAAINMTKDPTAFQGIKPCGMDVSVMTSVEELLGAVTSAEKFQSGLELQLKQLIG